MTPHQKNIVVELLRGGSIAASASGSFRLRDDQHNVIAKMGRRTWEWLRLYYLRKDKRSGLFLINKKKVRSLHGNSFSKRAYKNQNNKSSHDKKIDSN